MRTHTLPFKCDMCEKRFHSQLKVARSRQENQERKHLICRFECGSESMSRFMVHLAHKGSPYVRKVVFKRNSVVGGG